jgi:hypothetical protein
MAAGRANGARFLSLLLWDLAACLLRDQCRLDTAYLVTFAATPDPDNRPISDTTGPGPSAQAMVARLACLIVAIQVDIGERAKTVILEFINPIGALEEVATANRDDGVNFL